MKAVLIIFALSLILQIAVMSFILGDREPELYEYEKIAHNILTRHAFVCPRLGTEYHSLTPPLYPALCALVYSVTNYSHKAMLFVQMVLTAFTCVFVYLIGGRIFDKRAGIIGGVLCALHPGLVIYSTMKLHELSLVTFLFSFIIVKIIWFEDKSTYSRAFFIGFLMGACILTRATIVAFIPFFLLWLFMYRKVIFKLDKDFWFKSFFIVFIAALIILPWVARNYLIHREFIFMQTPAADIWVGNNANSTGTNYLKDGTPVLESMPDAFLKRVYESDELGQNKIFKGAVYEFIRENPGKVAVLFFKKLYYFWWFSPQSGIRYPHIYLDLYKIFYSVALFFAVYGFIFALINGSQKAKRGTLIILFLFFTISVAQSLFYVEGRHRWAVEPLLLIFAAEGISLCTNLLRGVFISKGWQR